MSIKPISISGTRADRALRLRVRPRQRPPQGDGRPQGQHHEAHATGCFWPSARKVAQEFPDIEFEDRIVDNMCMQLVQKPELYDVLVLPNLYGDILSDLAAGLVGGLGVAPGANIGPDGAVFEATHGSAPKYKGQNKVNPTALILSAVLMLHHLKENRRGRPTGEGRRSGDCRGERCHLRHEARPRRPHGGRHPGDGRGDLPEAGRGNRRRRRAQTGEENQENWLPWVAGREVFPMISVISPSLRWECPQNSARALPPGQFFCYDSVVNGPP